MLLLSKQELREQVIAAVTLSGWHAIPLDGPDAHPFRLRAVGAADSVVCKVYVWNLTHGGGPVRPADEYRIQVTGVRYFEELRGGATLILGWWSEAQVFAAFDYQRHRGELGSSPSIQIRESALRNAYAHGLAAQTKGSGEIALAFRPDLFMHYVQNRRGLHELGHSEHDAEVLNAVAADPYAVTDEDIASVGQARRTTVTTVRQALRDRSFRERVLRAYDRSCAVCAVQLGLVEAAHIVPVSVPDSTDDTSNGMAFCPTHHKAYDAALITIDDEYRVVLSARRVQALQEGHLESGLAAFQAALRPFIVLPAALADRPRAEVLRTGRLIRGWTD